MNENTIKVGTFWALLATLVLIVIVAVGNWGLYSRVEKIETILGLRAMPQSQQILQQPQR
jgi:hypothetical protein